MSRTTTSTPGPERGTTTGLTTDRRKGPPAAAALLPADRVESGREASAWPETAGLPFGPYAGMSPAQVASLDPDYLRAWLRVALGPPELRAAVARALGLALEAGPRSLPGRPAVSGWSTLPGPRPLPEPDVFDHPASGGVQPSTGSRRTLPWLLGAGAALLALGLSGRLGGEAGRAEQTSDAAGAADSAPAGPTFAVAARSAPAAASGSSGVARGMGFGAGGGLAAALPSAEPDLAVAAHGSASPASVTGDPVGIPEAAAPPFGESLPVSSGAMPLPGATDAARGYTVGAPCGRRVPGAIGAAEAETALDRFVTVEFAVRGSKDTGKVTFLNSQEPYQGRFYVALFPDLYPAFPPSPAQALRGRCVLVQGRVEAYRGVPQIVLRQAADLRDLGPAEASGP